MLLQTRGVAQSKTEMKARETVDYHIKATWYAISRMYNQQAAKYDITMSIGFALLTIHPEEGTPATKIAPQMGLEARSLTRILKTMEERGYIHKKPDPHDGRSVRIFLTDLGMEKRAISRDTVLRFNEVVRGRIPQEKLDVFFSVTDEISSLIEGNGIYETETSTHTPQNAE